jgi:hypothetical protein
VVPDDEFETMVARANRFRVEVGQLGWSAFVVDSNVRARLYWNPTIPELPADQESLADEIYELLGNSKLSAQQAAQLEREYFPLRR